MLLLVFLGVVSCAVYKDEPQKERRLQTRPRRWPYDYKGRTVRSDCFRHFPGHTDHPQVLPDPMTEIPSIVRINTYFPEIDYIPARGVMCAGTILKEQWIITTSTCTLPHFAMSTGKVIFIKQEELRKSAPMVYRVAKEVHYHPSVDMALLYIKPPFSTAYPARLPYAYKRDFFVNAELKMFGYGNQENVTMRRVFATAHCPVTNGLCVKDKNNMFMCNGDFGAPIMYHFNMMVGLVFNVQRKDNNTIVHAIRIFSTMDFITKTMEAAADKPRAVWLLLVPFGLVAVQ